MKTYKTDGIVLRSFKLKEADRIITILSPEFGRIEAIAKGIRRTKAKFGSRLEPLSEVGFMLYHGRSLDTITQARTISSFSGIRSDLGKTAVALSMLEITDKVSVSGESSEEVYEILRTALHALDDLEGQPQVIALTYDIKLLAATGFQPVLDSCASCGRKDVSAPRFSPYIGGIICSNCARESGAPSADLPEIGSDALKLWIYLRDTPFNVISERSPGIKLTRDRFGTVSCIVSSFVAHTFDVKLRSRDVIRSLGVAPDIGTEK